MARLTSTIDCLNQMSELTEALPATRRGGTDFQGKYLAISFGCHTIAFLLLMTLASESGRNKEVVIIDFDLNAPLQLPGKTDSITAATPKLQPAPPQPASQPALQPTLQQPVAGPRTADPQPSPQAAAAQTVAAPAVAATTALKGSGASGRAAAPVGSQQVTVNSGAGSGADREAVAEQKRKKYLKEHFEYIRELVTKKLTYPAVARKMEWSGKVVLAFVVKEDGGVDSLRLKESSGHKVLDNSAMETVRSVAPFPRPPVAAEIIIPVQFRLQ